MVAIVTGQGLGLSNSSASVLGQQGQFGAALLGKKNEAAYVNALNGNLILQDQDDFIAASGTNLALARTYNALGQGNDGNGTNWHLNSDRQILGLSGGLNQVGSSVSRIASDGSSTRFQYDATLQAYISQSGGGAYQSLTNEDGTWIWRADHHDKIGLFETYDSAGRLATVSRGDAQQNVQVLLAYSYLNNRLDHITDASGDTTQFLYFDDGNLRTIQTNGADGIARARVSYTYDQGRLSSVTTDLVRDEAVNSPTQSYTTYYGYKNSTSLISDIWQDDGSHLHVEYDYAGRVQSLTDATGQITSFDYSSTGQTSVTAPGNVITRYSYDNLGQLTQVDGPSTRSGSNTTLFSYNERGDVTAIQDARGNTTSLRYDANGNRIYEQDAAGNTLTRSYDAANNLLLSETRYLQAVAIGQMPAADNPALTTRYIYDANHLLRFQVSSEGRVTEYGYDALQQRTSIRQFQSDSINLNNLSGADLSNSSLFSRLQTWRNSGSLQLANSALRTFSYDGRGQLASDNSYNKLGADGNGLDADKVTTRFSYGVDGKLLQQIDANHNLTSFAYDGLGRLLASTDGVLALNDSGSQVDNNNAKTVTNSYIDHLNTPFDARNPNAALGFVSQMTVTRPVASSEAASGKALETINFDGMGRIVNDVSGTGGSAAANAGSNGSKSSFVYDKQGRLSYSEDALGQRQYVLYDEAGRKLADIDSAGSVTEYVYNQNSQVIKVTRYAQAMDLSLLANPNRVTGMSADVNLLNAWKAGHISRDPGFDVIAPTIAPRESAYDRSSWNIYDAAGRLTYSVDALGYVSAMRYDGASRLVQTTRYAKKLALSDLDTRSSLVESDLTIDKNAAQDRSTRLFYDKDGLLLGSLDAEGYLTRNSYNGAGKLIKSVAYAKL
ncbi:MAG: RHS repeat protein [Burkholderiales bacterium]|nr:RHS repeat protein [Burkholderiales bacterium]